MAFIDTGVARHRLLPYLVPGGDYVAHGTAPRPVTATAPSSPESSRRLPTRPVEFGGITPEAAVLAIRQSSMKFHASDAAGGDGEIVVESLAAAVRAAADQGATFINSTSAVACLAVADALDDRALGAALAYAVAHPQRGGRRRGRTMWTDRAPVQKPITAARSTRRA